VAGRECTVLFAKVKNPPDGSSQEDVLQRAWAQVNEASGVVVDHVVPGINVPRTTSGKAQRYQLLERFLAGEFDNIGIPRAWFDGSMGTATADVDAARSTATGTEERIRTVWADVLGIPAERIGPNLGFRSLGGTSVQAVQVLAGLERNFECALDYDLLLQCSSVREMAGYLAAGKGPSAPAGHRGDRRRRPLPWRRRDRSLLGQPCSGLGVGR
jgi:acyl carrier protein